MKKFVDCIRKVILTKQSVSCRKTIRRFIRAGEFPERKAARRPSRLDRFRNYLEQRWSEGCHDAPQLWREIQEQGYKGCRGMVANLATGFERLMKRAFGEPYPHSIYGYVAIVNDGDFA